MPVIIVEDCISQEKLEELAKERWGDIIKAVVDVERGIMAIGGELHADEEKMLLEGNSKQENLWGINIFLDGRADWIEFDSMINIRPAQNNRSREVVDPQIQKQITTIVQRLVGRA